MQTVVRGRKNPLYYGFPDRLRQARKRVGLTRTAASIASGLSNEAASQIEERQRLPRINTIERFAATLGVSPSWLAFGEGDEAVSMSASTALAVGERLSAARQACGLTRQALGVSAQIAGQAVANIELKGALPRVDTLELLAKALGVSPGWLAFGCGSPSAVGDVISERNHLGNRSAS